MAYKEPHFDSKGAKAFYNAITSMNDKVVKNAEKDQKPNKSTAKKSTAKKSTKKKGK